MTRDSETPSTGVYSTPPEQIKVEPLKSQDDILALTLRTLETLKAENILAIDLKENYALGDYMVIASAQSTRHVISLAEHLLRALKENKAGRARTEGLESGEWILVDIGDVIVHLFRQEVREFYDIEKMWLNETNAIDIARYLEQNKPIEV